MRAPNPNAPLGQREIKHRSCHTPPQVYGIVGNRRCGSIWPAHRPVSFAHARVHQRWPRTVRRHTQVAPPLARRAAKGGAPETRTPSFMCACPCCAPRAPAAQTRKQAPGIGWGFLPGLIASAAVALQRPLCCGSRAACVWVCRMSAGLTSWCFRRGEDERLSLQHRAPQVPDAGSMTRTREVRRRIPSSQHPLHLVQRARKPRLPWPCIHMQGVLSLSQQIAQCNRRTHFEL
jgi:hypothetical protein